MQVPSEIKIVVTREVWGHLDSEVIVGGIEGLEENRIVEIHHVWACVAKAVDDRVGVVSVQPT